LAIGVDSATGAVTEVDRRGHQFRIISGLPSMANTPGDTNAIGPHGIAVLGADQVFITNGGPTEPRVPATGADIPRETLAQSTPAADLFGRVLWIAHHRAVKVGDIWGFERAHNPDAAVGNPAIDSNPVDLLFDGFKIVVAHAGGNALDVVRPFGRVSNLAVFPGGQGRTPAYQAVPTSVVKGPDGFYYMSQLTGFPFIPGAANIFRVNPRTGAYTVLNTRSPAVATCASSRSRPARSTSRAGSPSGGTASTCPTTAARRAPGRS
jgi:hypothetical protein